MQDNLIYDIGMNNGDDTAYYLHRGYRVVAVEANPILAEEGKQRFASQIADGSLTILNVGIAEEEGAFPFWICDTKSEWSSFDRSNAARNDSPHHAITVPCQKFQSILAQFGVPYYLKIDIEGNDALCLNALQPENIPNYLSIEGRDVELLAELRDLGYTRFKCISQHNFLPLEFPPTPAQLEYERTMQQLRSRNVLTRAVMRLGARSRIEQELGKIRAYADWTFPYGSSGPFAEELPGRWQTFEELRDTYLRYRRMREEGKQSIFWMEAGFSFWTDFHARRKAE